MYNVYTYVCTVYTYKVKCILNIDSRNKLPAQNFVKIVPVLLAKRTEIYRQIDVKKIKQKL